MRSFISVVVAEDDPNDALIVQRASHFRYINRSFHSASLAIVFKTMCEWVAAPVSGLQENVADHPLHVAGL